jgi:hypothetical protein
LVTANVQAEGGRRGRTPAEPWRWGKRITCGGEKLQVSRAGDTNGDAEFAERAAEVIDLPEVLDYLRPPVAAVPLQPLAPHVACLRDVTWTTRTVN